MRYILGTSIDKLLTLEMGYLANDFPAYKPTLLPDIEYYGFLEKGFVCDLGEVVDEQLDPDAEKVIDAALWRSEPNLVESLDTIEAGVGNALLKRG